MHDATHGADIVTCFYCLVSTRLDLEGEKERDSEKYIVCARLLLDPISVLFPLISIVPYVGFHSFY